MYKKVPTTLNFVEREKETLKFWKDFVQTLPANVRK